MTDADEAWAAEAERLGPPTEPGTRVVLMPADVTDIESWQRLVNAEVTRRWPNNGLLEEMAALSEEVGEVARCILKRGEGTRGTAPEWTAKLRLELGQAMFVLINIAAMEGISAAHVLETAWLDLTAKPDRQAMDGKTPADIGQPASEAAAIIAATGA
jgi:NTP pyrophosphatase (non-canonical NTP hydrolase)